jgi:hypothetical protein
MRLAVAFCSLGLVVGLSAQDAAKPAITADEVIEKSIAATGGREAMSKMKSLTAKGTMEIVAMGATAVAELYAKAPDKRVSIINVDGYGEIRNGYDGKIAWNMEPQNGLAEMKGEMAAATKRESQFHGDLKWKDLYSKGEVTGKEKVGEKDCWVVKLTPNEGKPVTRYYEVESGLMVKSTATVVSPEGEAEVAVEFSDYGDMGNGVKMPKTMKITMPGIGDLITKYKEVAFDVEIDDAKFAMPKN